MTASLPETPIDKTPSGTTANGPGPSINKSGINNKIGIAYPSIGVFATAAGELGQQSIGRQNYKVFCAFALISSRRM